MRVTYWDGMNPASRAFEIALVTKRPSTPSHTSEAPQAAQLWPLHRLVIAAADDVSYDNFVEQNWEELDAVLVDAKRLEKLEILCGAVVTPDEFTTLCEKVSARMPRSRPRLRRSPEGETAISLEPELFARESMTFDSDFVFARDPLESELSLPKYTRI
jgi:hypothetical protein